MIYTVKKLLQLGNKWFHPGQLVKLTETQFLKLKDFVKPAKLADKDFKSRLRNNE